MRVERTPAANLKCISQDFAELFGELSTDGELEQPCGDVSQVKK